METIQIPHYAVGWEYSCSAKLDVKCSYGGTIDERELERAFKKDRWIDGRIRSRGNGIGRNGAK